MSIDVSWPPKLLLPQNDPRHQTFQSQCFFLQDTWLNSYIGEWDPSTFYGQISVANDPQNACALLSYSRRKSKLGIPYVSLGFNEASEQQIQNITLEFNDFLITSLEKTQDTSESGNILFSKRMRSALSVLLNRDDWHEIRLNAFSSEAAQQTESLARELGLISTVFSTNETYWIDLERIRTHHSASYIASRSANTRSQLRRALRNVEKTIGPCQIESAQTISQAHQWFQELGIFHLRKWEDSSVYEGFKNGRFVDFHLKIIEELWHSGSIQILRLRAGDRAIAYLYNFVSRGHIYFNLSGIDFNQDEINKPGMLAHWMAVDHSLAIGCHTYDFMAGTNRYKQSLCTNKTQQVSLRLRRKTIPFLAEDILRRFKRLRLFKANI